MTEQPKKMTVELLCEHNIKKDNALLKILTQALRLAGQDSDIVNDIEVTISIKFKNKFSSGKLSMKDKLKLFNQGNTSQKKPIEKE